LFSLEFLGRNEEDTRDHDFSWAHAVQKTVDCPCSGVIVEYNTTHPSRTFIMNRKLHNTILAFSVTGMMLFVGLVIAEPAQPGQDALPAALPVSSVHDSHDLDDAVGAAIDARAHAFELDVAGAADPGEALALTAGLIASTATEAALKTALAELRRDVGEREQARSGQERSRPVRRSGGSRDVIAVPYFSFARGSRGSRS
jgi:hypothetical protein